MTTKLIDSSLKGFVTVFTLLIWTMGFAQTTSNHGNKFEQLGTMLPSPNTYRNVDGNPGPDYWQQQCDYDITCTLDVEDLRLHGEEIITYHNNSKTTLSYLWMQLDENQHHPESDNHRFNSTRIRPTMSENALRRLEPWRELSEYGFNIQSITQENGEAINYVINKTMMRVDLPQPLKPGEKFTYRVKWNYKIIDRINTTSLARGGYEYFEKDGNYIFTITQWYPRLCAYTDSDGWQNNQFTGRGEFALTFGNFVVRMTLPEDYMVGSTGSCLNLQNVLTPTQWERWKKAQNATSPYQIVTLEEAKKLEKKKPSKALKTWIYKAENVRDFAWTASRKFIWDAMPHTTSIGTKVMCMSYYGKEAYPIYSKYSTPAVAHTLKVYSRFSIPYPYPVAISVEAASGMEYPMICFNPGRAEEDGTYSEGAKNACITVVIHEVGHNYYPMIINSDERQWAWFDEGLNSFVQFIAEQEWDNNYDSGGGPPHMIAGYMGQPKDRLEPIMTNSENIVNYFQNAYQKTATALNVLRETIMGRELFDQAFSEFGRRWAFKHPTPADFFRTMEDASGIDLDWFWRGWFYSIDHVDVSLDSIKWYKVDMENDPERQERKFPQKNTKPFDHLSKIRNREAGIEFEVEKDTNLQDFYTFYKPWETEDSLVEFTNILYDETFSKKEKEQFSDLNYYQLHFSNKGGLVSPVILEWTFEDGTKEIDRIPVEIWRLNENEFTKVFVKDKVATAIIVDPFKETADTDESNNNWPIKELPSRFQVYKRNKFSPPPNPMQREMKKKKKLIKP